MSSIMKEDWIECELGEVCFKITDGTHRTPKYIADGVHFISVKDIYNGLVNFENTKFISNEEHSELIKRCNPEFGDLLITKSGTIGRMAIVPQMPEFSLFVSVALIKNMKHIIYSKFLMYAMEDYMKSISISQVIKGGLLKNFHLEDIRKTIIPLAPLPIQRAIVSKIEALFSDLDNGIANLKKAQEQLKIYRQAVLKKAFEGKLSALGLDRLKDDRIIDTETKGKGEILKSQNPKNPNSDNLPNGWKWVKLGEVATKIGSGSTPSGGQENYKTEGIPLIRSMNIHFDFIKYEGLAFIDEKQAKKLKNVIVYENDILLNITGASIGRVNLAPKQFNNARVNQHVSIIRLKKEDFIAQFVKYYLQSPKIQDWINAENYGATRQALSKTMIENIEIPFPTIQEQTQIVQEIERRLSVCDKMEQSITESLEKAEALRQSILKKAFEGKLLSEAEIAQCKQAADYEPASELLKKIKAEKLAKEQAKKKK